MSIELDQAMHDLNAQWYNAVVNGCGLQPGNFQLVQGNTALGALSENIWNMMDAMPPNTINYYYDPNSFNSFSSAYSGIINNLEPQNSDEFRYAMGDYYNQWSSYQTDPATIWPTGGTPIQNVIALFNKWAFSNLDPDKAQKCITLYEQVANGVVPVAVSMWNQMKNAKVNGNIRAYNGTIDQVNSALIRTPSKTVILDSKTGSQNLSSWSTGVTGGLFGLFWGSGGMSDYEAVSLAMFKAGIKIEVSFANLLTYPMGPLSQPSQDPILKNFTPWYYSEALMLAYHHNDNRVWKHGAPTWDDSFGANGNLKRLLSALVIVDGINIKMTSTAGIGIANRSQFESNVRAGFWPFFSVGNRNGWVNSVTFNDDGTITIISNSAKGNPNILGVIVTPISSL